MAGSLQGIKNRHMGSADVELAAAGEGLVAITTVAANFMFAHVVRRKLLWCLTSLQAPS
jgi:hypothetical protein